MSDPLLEDFSRPPVPQAWTDLMAAVHAAEVARATLNLPDLPIPAHDQAIAEYSRTADRIIDLLIALRADHTLGRITNLLARKERR